MPEGKSPKKPIKPVVEEIITDPSPNPNMPQAKTTDSSSLEPQPLPVDPQPNATQAPPVPPAVPPQSPALTPPPGVSIPKKGFHINLGFLFVVLIVAVVVALVSGALYVYFNTVKGNPSESQPTPVATIEPAATPTATTEASSTPEAMQELDTYKVSVLNGSGKPGEAGNVSDLLEGAGFKVTSTGNADNFNFKNTLIQVKSGVSSQVVAKMKEALSGDYSVEVGDTLNSKSSFDIIVTVGSN